MSGPSQNSLTQSLVLLRHLSTPCDAVRGITVEVQPRGGTLELRYFVAGDIERVRVPALAPPSRADQLWQHTCFEAFIAEEDIALGYREFNFAPSTEWAIYQFSGYRNGMTVVDVEHAPTVAVQRDGKGLSLIARVDIEPLSDLDRDRRLRLAISAVIEESNGAISYWALAHPPGKPDFHHADGFVVML
jgi:hypothetical protein